MSNSLSAKCLQKLLADVKKSPLTRQELKELSIFTVIKPKLEYIHHGIIPYSDIYMGLFFGVTKTDIV